MLYFIEYTMKYGEWYYDTHKKNNYIIYASNCYNV